MGVFGGGQKIARRWRKSRAELLEVGHDGSTSKSPELRTMAASSQSDSHRSRAREESGI